MKPINTYTARYQSKDGNTHNQTITAYRIADARAMFREWHRSDLIAVHTVRISKNKKV